jgi:muconate cycloisomerase
MNGATADAEDTRQERIVALDCFPARLPLRKPIASNAGAVRAVEVLYVRLRSAGGGEGWGEAIADPGNTGETVGGMIAMIAARLSPALIGQVVRERAAVMAKLRSSIYANRAAITAVEMAWLDLAGKLYGVPVVELLGGARRDRAPLIAIVGSTGSASDAIEEAAEQRAAGVRAFKLKVGLGRLDADLDCLRALRQAVGEDCFLAADANMAWDVDTALRFARAAADIGLDCLEQPVAKEHGRMAALGTRSPVRIAADEAIHGANDLLALADAGAIAGASLKSIKLGGVSQAVELAAVADARGLAIGFAMMMESGLATAAMVHAACAAPRLDWYLNAGMDFLANDPLAAAFDRRDGCIHLPTTPGLGMPMCEDFAAR